MAEILDELESYASAAQLKEQANALVRRILGGAYALSWENREPVLLLDAEKYKVRWPALSSGEQVALAFCLFLVLAYARKHPQTWLLFNNSLQALDSLKYFRAMTCLRDFVIATGASVLLESDNKSHQFMAKQMLSHASEADAITRKQAACV